MLVIGTQTSGAHVATYISHAIHKAHEICLAPHEGFDTRTYACHASNLSVISEKLIDQPEQLHHALILSQIFVTLRRQDHGDYYRKSTI